MAFLFELHLTTINSFATPVQTFNQSILFVQLLLSCSAILSVKNQKVFNGGKTLYFELALLIQPLFSHAKIILKGHPCKNYMLNR